MPTDTVFLIRPARFTFNKQTASNNSFQQQEDGSEEVIQRKAVEEFDLLVSKLRDADIEVVVFEDEVENKTPDSIFPNNWISTHEEGTIVLYPMYAENRRREVRQDIVGQLCEQFGFDEIVDWTPLVNKNQFLEGTGSLVLDRYHGLAYCCESERSNRELAEKWCEEMGYELILFQAFDEQSVPIYHTNVLMSVGQQFVTICYDAIPNEEERELLEDSFVASGKRIVPISFEQMNLFAGNMIELKNESGEHVLVLSEAAFQSLHEIQIKEFENYCTILTCPVPTIEKNGGGSVRCMIAEVFAPFQ